MSWILKLGGVDGKRLAATDPTMTTPEYLLAWDPNYQPPNLDPTGPPPGKGVVTRTNDPAKAMTFANQGAAQAYAVRVTGHIWDPGQV